MLGVAAVVLSFTSGLAAAWWGIAPGIIALCAAVIYLTLVIRDIVLFSRSLDRALGGNCQPRAAENRFMTVPGRVLSMRLEGFRHKLNALNWQIEKVSPHHDTLPEDEIMEGLESCLKDSDSAQPEFFEKVADAIKDRFRANALALILMEKDPGSGRPCTRVVFRGRKSGHIPGARLNSELTAFYLPLLSGNPDGLLGFRDGAMSSSIGGEFSVFGYRYTVARSFMYSNLDRDQSTGVIWLGYGADNMPYEREDELAVLVASKIEKRLVSARIMYELSTRVQQARQTEKQQSDFIAHASHDIRSPLNNIQAILNLFKLESQPGEAREMLEVALGNCNQMSEIVEDILDLTKHQAGQLAARPEQVRAENVLREVADTHSVAAKLKGLKFQCSAEHPDLYVLADKRHLKRIINNLISNAIKYTKRGEVFCGLSGDDQNCRIIVRDTGSGMSREQLDKLFTPFSRFHQSEADGIGLGLTLSRILAELNGGTITAVSEPGKGSSFEVCLPLHAAAENPEPLLVLPKFDRIAPEGAVSKSILVVDDDPDCVDTLCRVLSRSGYLLLKAYTVMDAVSILNFEKPDLVITDLHMPDGGGRKLLQFLSARPPGIRTLVLSGVDNEREKQEVLEAGADRILPKPAKIEEIISWIELGSDEESLRVA